MSFTPFPKRIWFEKLTTEKAFSSEGELVEAGKVLGVGEGVTFVKEGDTVYFLAFGVEVAKDMEGNEYNTVLEDNRFIIGKHAV